MSRPSIIDLLSQELQTKRDTIKRYEQELQSMKQLFDIALKEKQIQSDQLKHERLRKALPRKNGCIFFFLSSLPK